MVIWLIGLSGTGKTVLGQEVVATANKNYKNTIFIDGDEIREAFGNDLSYSMKDRLINAQRICQLGKFLDDQGMNVVCSILSLFPDTRQWNRENIKNYYEVYVDTPIDILIKRDSKGIYNKYLNNKITNVAGMDIEFPIPDQADLVIDNVNSKEHLLSHAKQIAKKIILQQ
jgi:cytidine diphosphoramidate kinase